MTSLTKSLSLPKLIKTVNYNNWNLKMKVLLDFQENWEVVENGHAKLENTKIWSKSQMNALRAARKKDKASL